MKRLYSIAILLIIFVLLSLWMPTPNVNALEANLQQATPTALPTSFVANLPQPIDILSLSRRMEPSNLVVGQPANVTLTLNISSDDACQGIPGQPVDVVFVFDISTSAGVGPGSNWETTIGLTKTLLANLSQPIYQDANISGKSKVGLVSSQTGTLGPEPILLQSITDDYIALDNALTTMNPSGDTDIAAGLAMAEDNLLSSKTAGRSQAIIVFLHDNVALNESTVKAVEATMSNNIPVYFVVNSLNISEDEKITLEVADKIVPSKQVFIDPNSREIRAIFIDTTHGSNQALARAINIKEHYIPEGQVRLLNPSAGGTVTDQTVAWSIPLYEKGDKDLAYQVEMKNSSIEGLTINTDISWIDCNGYPHYTQNAPQDITSVQSELPDANTNGAPSTSNTPPPENTTWDDRDLGIPFLAGLPWIPDWLWLLLLLLFLLLLFWLLSKLFRKPKRILPRVAPPRRRGDTVISHESVNINKKTSSENKIMPGVTTQYLNKDGTVYRTFKSVQPEFTDAKKFLENGQKVTISHWIKPSDKNTELARITFETVKTTTKNKLTGEDENEITSNITQLYIKENELGTLMLENAIEDMMALDSKSISLPLSSENQKATSFLLSNGFENKNNSIVKKL